MYNFKKVMHKKNKELYINIFLIIFKLLNILYNFHSNHKKFSNTKNFNLKKILQYLAPKRIPIKNIMQFHYITFSAIIFD